MHTDPSSPSETARRAFLEPVEALLSTAGIAWTSIEYRAIRPFGSVGLAVTAPGMPGEAQVVAISLYNKSAIDYAHFPDNGKLSYQLLIKNAGNYFVEQCISQDPEIIVSTLKVWATLNQGTQRHALPSLEAHNLDPLRRLATIRATIAREIQSVLARGIERCSEEAGQKLGIIRADNFEHSVNDLTLGARANLNNNLQYLAPDLLMKHFPREEDGRLLLGATVLLASYASTLPQSRGRQMWLVACAPRRRRDPQVVTLCLDSLIGVNHVYRWDQAGWLWDSRQQAASTEEERWGVSDLDIELLGLDKRAEHIALFTERCAQPNPSLADRVSLCLLLQDAGRFEEALALFGIELTTDVLKILYNQPLSLHTYGRTASWSATLMGVLCFAAPWRFATLQAGTHHRICALPHQTQQRKASLVLVTSKKEHQGKAPIFIIEETASNKLLPSVAWKRPLDLDLKRFQNAIKSEAPDSVGLQQHTQ